MDFVINDVSNYVIADYGHKYIVMSMTCFFFTTDMNQTLTEMQKHPHDDLTTYVPTYLPTRFTYGTITYNRK